MTSRPTRRIEGFTLVEILVVIVLIAGIFILAAPQVGSYKRVALNTAAREIGAVFKEAYNASQMSGRAYRLVFDLKNDEYWVEAGPRNLLLDTEETREAERRRQRFARKSDEEQAAQGPAFQQDKRITRRKQSLPRGVEFEAILTDQDPEPVKSGSAYTHILPHGLTERTVIQIADARDNPMSLILSPLLGHVRIEARPVTLKEAYAEP